MNASISDENAIGTRRRLGTLALSGAAMFCAGLFFDPAGAWSGYLVAFLFLSGLAVAGPFFLSIHHLVGARWSTPLLPIPRAMTRLLPAALLLGLGLLAGLHQLYEWSHAAAVAADPGLARKSAWLGAAGFGSRLVVIFGAWILLARRVVACEGEPRRGTVVRRTALFIAVFGVTYSVAAFDWVGSLTPHWASTIYALDLAGGLVASGIAAVIVVAVLLRRSGRLPAALTADRLNDLGKLALTFSLFWGYVAYCQYMLIWYTNLPEETSHYLRRQGEGFGTLTWVNIGLNWSVPFFSLLSRAARTSEAVLFRVACVMLVGRLVDLWMHVAPTTTPGRAVPGWAAVGVVAATTIAALYAVVAATGARPVHDADSDPEQTCIRPHTRSSNSSARQEPPPCTTPS